MMPVYINLKAAILALLTAPSAFALSLDPIEVQSGAGNLFYAEIKFQNADPNSPIEAGLAESQDLVNLGMAHQPPSSHLNFFTRKSADGSGVIVITSSRPLLESELDILIKIKEGNATHIQQIKTPLKPSLKAQKPQLSHRETVLIPQTIVSEKDIALNLPMSSQHNPTTNTPSQAVNSASSNSITVASSSEQSVAIPLAINVAPVPSMNSSKMTTLTAASKPAVEIIPPVPTSTQKPSDQSYAQPSIATAQALASTLTLSETIRSHSSAGTATDKVSEQPALERVQPQATESAKNPAAAKTKAPTQADTETKANSAQQNTTLKKPVNLEKTSHIVQANESLWAIAAKVAAQNNQSIRQVMQQIKNNNEHAFIDGNVNRIRRGVVLNIASSSAQQSAKPRQDTPLNTKTNRAQSGKEKYKLNQAEMKLLAEHKQDSAQGSAKEQSSKNQTSAELAAKVMTVREKTVKLQQNVSQLKLTIQQKDQRIQLLNARLAQLQQQLQQKSQAGKSAH